LGISETENLLEEKSLALEEIAQPDVSDESRQFRLEPEGNLSYHGPTSIYRLGRDRAVRESREVSHMPPQTPSTYSPYSAQDPAIHTALRIFFQWQYPNFMFVYREAFLLDFLTHAFNGKYCSPALVYSVCAIGSRMSAETSISSAATTYRQEAHRALFSSGLPSPSITNIQALLCLAFAELGEGAVSSAWLLSGTLTTMPRYQGAEC
jgi:hypothetical protein